MICLDPGVLVKGLNAEDGLYNGFCRMDCVWGRQEVYDTTEGWTCRRSSDGMFVQIDFILSDANALAEANWNDFIIPIGIDHRCVHCRLAFRTRTQKQLQQHGMKHWTPHMDGLDTHQPEKQHGFRGGTRVEEHLVTTHLVLHKFPKVNVPIWIISEHLSKVFFFLATFFSRWVWLDYLQNFFFVIASTVTSPVGLPTVCGPSRF